MEWNEVWNKTKEVFDAACKKTGEVVTTEKQRLDVTALKAKREKDFAALGKWYFDAVGDGNGESADVQELLAAIREKNEKIDRLQEEIRRAGSHRLCPKCGAVIEENSVFCNRCGERVIFDSAEEETENE